MSTKITTLPIPTAPLGLSSNLEYDLSAEDFVACWRFLARESPAHLPPEVSQALVAAILGVSFAISVPLLFLGLACLASGFQGVSRIIALVGLIPMLFGFLGVGHPGLFLDCSLAKPYRWARMLSLRLLARDEARKGRTKLLDTLSHYCFVMNRGGVTVGTEYQQRSGGNPVILRRRQDKIAWREVEVIGNTEQHVFFIVRDLIPVIVPRSCFPDDSSFRLFAQMVKCYHEGRGAFMPRSCRASDNEPRFNLPRSQAVTPGRDSRFRPRPS